MEETRVEVKNNVNEISKAAILFNKFIANPFWAGVSGFTLFFLFAIALDFIVNITDPEKTLTIDILTVFIGIIGFLLAFIYSALDKINQE